MDVTLGFLLVLWCCGGADDLKGERGKGHAPSGWFIYKKKHKIKYNILRYNLPLVARSTILIVWIERAIFLLLYLYSVYNILKNGGAVW